MKSQKRDLSSESGEQSQYRPSFKIKIIIIIDLFRNQSPLSFYKEWNV